VIKAPKDLPRSLKKSEIILPVGLSNLLSTQDERRLLTKILNWHTSNGVDHPNSEIRRGFQGKHCIGL